MDGVLHREARARRRAAALELKGAGAPGGGYYDLCLRDASEAPWSGSPPRSDPSRRTEDPEVSIVARAGLVEAYEQFTSSSGSGLKGSKGGGFGTGVWGALTTRKGGGGGGGGAGKSAWAIQSSAPPPVRSPLPLPGSPGHQKVWITLTTLPGRIYQIERTVMSLLHQTTPADELVISVPAHSDREGTAYPTPDWLQRLVERRVEPPFVRIRRVPVDFGPATKLIPSVMEAQRELGENVLLLVVDDDTLYPPRLLETLLEWNRRLPEAALAFSGWPVITKSFK